MLSKSDVELLKSQVEQAMEVLLRAADERVSWKQSDGGTTPTGPMYSFLPGLYYSDAPHSNPTANQQHEAEHEVTTTTPVPLKTAASTRMSMLHPPLPPVVEPAADGDGCKTRVVLHGDNTFEYVWTMRRSGARAMDFTVEMEGAWSKPMLNRTRRGDEDQRIFLSARRIRFERLSNFDAENQTWKLCLRTLTRHGSDWANVGVTERGVPPIVMIFHCVDGCLESTGAAQPAHVLTNSPACRVLAGLTKKIANKLGAPVDVMTDKWLPARGLRLSLAESDEVKIKQFNPFYCLAEALRSKKQVSEAQ